MEIITNNTTPKINENIENNGDNTTNKEYEEKKLNDLFIEYYRVALEINNIEYEKFLKVRINNCINIFIY